MIRINLLSEGKRPVAARKAQMPSLDLGGLELTSVLLVALALLGLLVSLGHNFLLGRRVEAVEGRVNEAQAEVDRLAPIIKEVEEFKAKKAELERKVDVISDLKNTQSGPVRIMDMVSRALPELLWLRRMEVAGSKVSLEGQAFNTNAVANFIENLDKVPEFKEPVLQDTAQQNEVYNFKVTFDFTVVQPAAGQGTEGS